jgi:minor extracellular serine protease Vpr
MRKVFLVKIFLVLLIANLVIIGNDKSQRMQKFEEAGIQQEQLIKVDFEIRNLIYSNLVSKKQFNLKKDIDNHAEAMAANYVSAFIKSSSPELTKAEIEQNGGKVSNIISDILVAELPVDKLSDIVFNDEIKRVEASQFREPLLDKSLQSINVDKIHLGTGLPKAYKGEGVVVGVLDSGIDWTHPAFSNDNGNRILYLWDMSDDTNPPDGYTHGTEYTKSDLDQFNSNQVDDNGHGTHVASTAAGNANGEDYPLDGVAPHADIIFVKGFRAGEGFDDADIVRGCTYIFDKAEAMGKPAVINLSLGGVDGSQGTSLYEQALTNLTGPGKLIAAAAGNEGTDYLHLQYQMTGSTFPERTTTYWRINESDQAENALILGYPLGEDFNIGVQALDLTSQALVHQSSPVGHNNEITEFMIIEGDTLAGITISGMPDSDEENFFGVQFEYEAGTDFSNYLFTLYTYGSTMFNAWIINGVFGSDTDASLKLIGGDTRMTINSPSSAFNVFSVGAFTTSMNWTDIDGNPITDNSLGAIGDRAYFSSLGPLRDGRIKPDFSAPGHWIAAAHSKDAAAEREYLSNDKIIYQQGTSMATPHFAGVLALLLEQKPDLTYEEAYSVLQNSSVVDDLTGSVPNNEFGHGKIDAYAALQQLVTTVEEEVVLPAEFALLQNYPNPFNPATTVTYSIPTKNHVTIKVYDVLGNEVATLVNAEKPAGNHNVEFDANNFSSGLYFYRINAGNFNEVKKMMLLK